MSYNRSTFPEQIDLPIEMFDISPLDKPDIDEYFTLRILTNPTQVQTDRMAYLLTTYNNKILNAEKINYFLDIAINTEKFWFDTVNNYLKFITNYDNLYSYKIYNITLDINGDLYMSLVSNNVGNPLSDSSKWRKISQRGLQGIQGERGFAGIGLAFIGSYDPSATYTINQGVEENGSLWGCISSQPVMGLSPSSNPNSWKLVVSKGNSTFLTVLRNSVIVNTNTAIIPIGIAGFNKNNDQIFVYKDNDYIELGQEYTLNSDGLSIVKEIGTWDGTITPINFNFVVFKNIVQGVALSDGSLIQIQSITLDKLNIDIQNKINKIGVAVLQTTAQDLSGAVNENTNNLIAHQADTAYQVATGTATAITVTTTTLVNGYAKTFIASANNGGVATTINTKPLYKPSTVIAPTLIAGKAYTVWYNLAGVCFFIKASAEGTATVAQVLAGVPFSNETDTGLVGTMPNRAGDTAALASSVVGTTLKLRASAGSRDGIDDNVTITDADFIASNIVLDKNVLGLVGTYDNLYGNSSDGVLNTVGNLNLVAPANGGPVIKHYSSITINAGHIVTSNVPCTGIILFCEGNCTINGTLTMSKKGKKAVQGVVRYIPEIVQVKNIALPSGGSSGSGGESQGLSGGNGGSAIAYVLPLLGSPGGGGGGAAFPFSGGGIGGNGGASLHPYNEGTGGVGGIVDGGGGSAGVNGKGGGGSCGNIDGRSGGAGGLGAGAGGGGGGSGSSSAVGSPGAPGEPLGGSIILIVKGNIIIGSTGIISCNGGNGGKGGNGATGANEGNPGGGGGASGGGTVLVIHKGTYSNLGSITVSAGIGGASGLHAVEGAISNPGTAGGIGTVSVNQIV